MSRRFPRFLFAAALSLTIGGAAVRAQEGDGRDVVYGALVFATKSEHPQPVPDAIKPQADSLQRIFGYNEFRLLSEKKKAVNTGQEDLLVLSRQLILHVDALRAIADGYTLALALQEEDRPVVKADVRLKRDHPLFIRGPFVGNGQILILLTVL